MYSVTKAAKKLGTTRTTIYNKLRQPEFESLVTTEKGQSMLTEELINLIGESLKPKSNTKQPSEQVDEQLGANISQVLQTLTEQLTSKDRQIKALEDQIAAMQAHSDNLVRLNDNQQQLLGRNMLQLESAEQKEEKTGLIEKMFGLFNKR